MFEKFHTPRYLRTGEGLLHRSRLRSAAWIFAYIELAVAKYFRSTIFIKRPARALQWSSAAGLGRGTSLVKRLNQVFAISTQGESRKMNDAGVLIKDYLGDFVANHVDLSDGRVALKISPREVEILGESLVKEVIGWAMDSKSSPWPEYGNYDADFQAGLCAGQRDASEDDVVVRFTSRDVLALGQFFVLSMLKWVQSVQIARRRAHRLREAILAKTGAGFEYDEDDDDELLINRSLKWRERHE
jgi:hypothetical protein